MTAAASIAASRVAAEGVAKAGSQRRLSPDDVRQWGGWLATGTRE